MPTTYSSCSRCGRINKVDLSTTVASTAQRRPVCGQCQTELPLHGAVNEVDARGLEALVSKSPLPVVADFWAPWCGPCRAFAPTFETAAREMAGQFVFVKVNTDAHPFAASQHRIRGIPTLILFESGQEMRRQSGTLPLAQFIAWLK